MMNCCHFIGRLTKDPETRTIATTSGETFEVTSGVLAVDRYKQKTSDFITIIWHNKLALVAQKYLKKGSQIAITGDLRTRNYKKQDGTYVNVYEVNVHDMHFLELKPKTNEKSAHNTLDRLDEAYPDYGSDDRSPIAVDDTDLPF